MTLTTIVGSSGSGKTTFLNDVYEYHQCIYIRQYHSMRPYIPVTKIPNFDPSRLPFWEIYVKEGMADSIKVGGTMAGDFTAGFSGGQRKLLLFELICQRSADQSELLIVLDEPFSGVTNDFVPFIIDRLNEMRKKHNLVLVTNDYVDVLTGLADNIITVSALDRTKVKINEIEAVDRQQALFALSIGDEFQFKMSGDDLRFFFDVECYSNQGLVQIFIFSLFCFVLFIATFWDSDKDQSALVLIGGETITYLCINPYILSLVAWRNANGEEADALMHSSKSLNCVLKATLATFIVLLIAVAEYVVVNAVCNGLSGFNILVAMFLDSFAVTFPLICLGIYTKMGCQTAELFGCLPYLFMVFFSTTFSPGSGVPGIKELRYLCTRFYFWCMVPGVQDEMEGCPDKALNMLFMILSSLVGVFVFLIDKLYNWARSTRAKALKKTIQKESMIDEAFVAFQTSLYGEKMLKRLKRLDSSLNS